MSVQLVAPLPRSEESSYPELAGKRVVLCLGRSRTSIEVARAYARHGCHIVVHTVHDETAAQIVDGIESTAGLRVFGGDLKRHGAPERFTRTAIAAFDGADIVVTDAALEMPAPAALRSAAAIERHVSLSLKTSWLVSQTAAATLRQIGAPGTIIHLTTLPGPASNSLRSVARDMIERLTRAQAQELAADGIRVNAIVPDRARPAKPADGAVLGDDAVATALYLASSRSAWISGMTLSV